MADTAVSTVSRAPQRGPRGQPRNKGRPPPRGRPLSPRGRPPHMKRKRPTEDDGQPDQKKPDQKQQKQGSGDQGDQGDQPRAQKKPKLKKKRKPKADGNNGDDGDIDYDLHINRSVASMDSRLLADYVAAQTRRFGSDLSPVELADLMLGAHAITDTTSYDKDRTLANLPDFLQNFCAGGAKHLSSAPSANGAPHTIIITGAGMRAADLVRAVRPFQTASSTVSKLFAKHIKIADAISFLKSHRTGIAVGTPARLIDLLDQGALSVAHLQRMVVDMSHVDQKKRGVLDMQDTALPVVRWLTRPDLRARYGGDEPADKQEAENTESRKGGKQESEKSAQLSVLFY